MSVAAMTWVLNEAPVNNPTSVRQTTNPKSLEWFAMMVRCAAALPVTERSELTEWDDQPDTATSDWPGWARYLPHPPPAPPRPAPPPKAVARRKATISRSLARAVMERDAYRCRHCGTHLDLTCDHMVPESAGGSTDFENLQTLCRSCNSRKGVS